MEEIAQVTEVARGVSEFGALAMMAGAYLVISLLILLTSFRWFKSLIDRIVTSEAEKMEKLLKKTETQNDLLNDIADGLRPTTLLQVSHIANTNFDLSVEKVCRLVETIREQNHIMDKDATLVKIGMLVRNVHADRNNAFDVILYRGHKLSHYTNAEWIGWVAETVEREVYAEKFNEMRLRTNIEAVYSRIRLDFHKRLAE